MAPENAQPGRHLRKPLQAAISAGLLLAVFLVGYIPPSLRASRLEDEKRSLQDHVTAARSLGYLGMLNYEVQRNNYASAAEHSTRFFNLVREARGTVRDEASRGPLDALLSRRDEITAGLAAVDPTVKEKVAGMYADLFKTTFPQ